MAVCPSDRLIAGAMRRQRSAQCSVASIFVSRNRRPTRRAIAIWGLQALQLAIGGRTTIAAASTHPGEEIALIDTHRKLRNSFPQLLTLIAPRHPDRGR